MPGSLTVCADLPRAGQNPRRPCALDGPLPSPAAQARPGERPSSNRPRSSSLPAATLRAGDFRQRVAGPGPMSLRRFVLRRAVRRVSDGWPSDGVVAISSRRDVQQHIDPAKTRAPSPATHARTRWPERIHRGQEARLAQNFGPGVGHLRCHLIGPHRSDLSSTRRRLSRTDHIPRLYGQSAAATRVAVMPRGCCVFQCARSTRWPGLASSRGHVADLHALDSCVASSISLPGTLATSPGDRGRDRLQNRIASSTCSSCGRACRGDHTASSQHRCAARVRSRSQSAIMPQLIAG